ncbi:MAG: hypothetical protein HWN79_04235 [Candidatus Lokiarchaeota archaeon]|nr:hypothetical protein [Candidatus Lokiarchaeota archaeon]
MDTANIRSYNTTLKKMISLAKNLAKNEIPIIYELGHYLADNVISKVCMVVLARNNRPDLIFENEKDGRTYDFPILYKNMRREFFPNLEKYEKIVKDFHIERGIYQHRFESLKQTFRQSEAEKYVDFVINTMRKTGILGTKELIPYVSLLSEPTTVKNYEIRIKQDAYQELYNLLIDPEKKNIIIALKNKLDFRLKRYLKEDLIMEEHSSYGYTTIHNSEWSIDGFSQRFSIVDKTNNETFSYNQPTTNKHVLEEFLKYFKGCLKEQGINIKDFN